MSDDVLFTLTSAHLDTGMRGIPVGTCRTSKVDPIKGVSYVGHPIADLAFKDPEEVAFLLLEHHLPSADELVAFSDDLRSRQGIDNRVFDVLRMLPREGHPMEWLGNGLTLLGMTCKTGDWAEDARNLIARAPQLVAAIFRLRSGWGDPIAPRSDLGLIENFVYMLGVPGADPRRITSLLRTFYILHMDHGGGNLSTFTGKAVASGHADMYSAVGAAMAGLSGPLHGRANQDCLNFVRQIGTDDEASVETFVREKLAGGGKVFGFGHAVLRAEDPRATIQYALGAKLYGDDPLYRTASTLRKVAVRVLKEMPKVANPYPNVDAVSGSLLNASGLTDSNYYTVLFGLARMTGIAAQIVDERTRARGGRGVPIYRPKFIAVDQG
ncbi:MAG: citrate (Si)-synthase [Rhodobacterales bacterium]|nr:citrate (Si)-synthase [Rhodobacterales bacterium]